MDATRWPRLEALLAQRGLLSAAAIARELGISQPTVSTGGVSRPNSSATAGSMRTTRVGCGAMAGSAR